MAPVGEEEGEAGGVEARGAGGMEACQALEACWVLLGGATQGQVPLLEQP